MKFQAQKNVLTLCNASRLNLPLMALVEKNSQSLHAYPSLRRRLNLTARVKIYLISVIAASFHLAFLLLSDVASLRFSLQNSNGVLMTQIWNPVRLQQVDVVVF